jgi:hypothetical protein
MVLNHADAKIQAPAFVLGTTTNDVHLQLYGKDNLPHAQLNFDGKGKPAWQCNDAQSAAQAAKSATH